MLRVRSPEKQVAEDSHVNDCSEHNDRETTDVLHQGAKNDRTDCIDDAEANHHVANLVNTQCARDISLLNI